MSELQRLDVPAPRWTRPLRAHQLGGNARVFTPSTVYYLDTETGQEQRDGATSLPLRCWVLRKVERRRPEGLRCRVEDVSGTTGIELARWLDAHVLTTGSHWLFAHNLGFDLVTTHLPQHLAALGWGWTGGTLASDEPWVVMSRGNHTLTMCDSHSHLPASLERIGQRIGLEKLQRPASDADLEDVLRYCERDVRVLSLAMQQLLDWWDAERLGSFSVSGPQCGWNSWRHKFSPAVVRIDTRADWRAFARAGIYGGRRECWRVGELSGGPWVELDMQLAHAHVVRDNPLPVRIVDEIPTLDLDSPMWGLRQKRQKPAWLPQYGPPAGHRWESALQVMADCVVTTASPRYPVSTGAGVLYPVGTFHTRLAWPELQDARRRGDLVSVGKGLLVASWDAMSGWAAWIIDQLTRPHPETPPAALLALKGWSRTVFGKWAARRSRVWSDDVNDTGLTFAIEHAHIAGGAAGIAVHLGDRTRTFIRDQEADDSFPVAYAWIASYTRLALQRIIDALGEQSVVVCNTDSVVVSLDALRQYAGFVAGDDELLIEHSCRQLSSLPGVPPIGCKGVISSMRLLAPDVAVVELNGRLRRRVIGVHHESQEVDPWVFEGDVWPGVQKQLSLGQGERFTLERRRLDLSRVHPLRWVTESGRCDPVEMQLGAGGENELLPPWWDALGAAADHQHPALVAASTAGGT